MLKAPDQAPEIFLKDINGETIEVGNGKPTYLAFYRDAACPFCNMHIYRLTNEYVKYNKMGLNLIAIFASSPEDVRKFVLARPRPFRIAAEPSGQLYEVYGVQRSFWRKLLAVLKHFPTLLGGLGKLGLLGSLKGMGGLNTNNMMPADFLIDGNGKIVEAYYGKDAADHIPFERIEVFLAQQHFKQQ